MEQHKDSADPSPCARSSRRSGRLSRARTANSFRRMDREKSHSRPMLPRRWRAPSPCTSPSGDSRRKRSPRRQFQLLPTTELASRRAASAAPGPLLSGRQESEKGTTAKSASRCRLRKTEWPTFGIPRPEKKRQETQRQDTDAEDDHTQLGGGEDEDPAEQRNQSRHRIEPHPVRARHVRRVLPQQHQTNYLSHELHQDTCDDECINHRAQREESGDDRQDSQYDQRDVREILCRMQSAEDPEEVTAFRRGEWNSRVAEQQREHRSERSPQHQQGEDRGNRAAVDLLHEHRDDKVGCRVVACRNELAPRYHTDDRKVDAYVNDRDGDGA